MTAEAFRTKRRQKFLTEDYFDLNTAYLLHSNEVDTRGTFNLRARGDLDPVGQGGIFGNELDLLKLQYTAGYAIEELRPLYVDVVTALGAWNDAYRVYIKSLDETGEELRDDGTPLYFEDLVYFQRLMEVVSVGVLLGEGDALRRIATYLARYRGTDLLFEFLISPAVPDARDNTDFFHARPYDPLIDAFYTAETPEQSIAFVKTYLEGWYKSFEGTPWHNGHLKGTTEYMPYYGYWSFEAAAVCVIHGIDDKSFRDHLVYPKDLADWARSHDCLAQLRLDAAPQGDAAQRLRCEGGRPCPRQGWWSTPAQPASRRKFQLGEMMPSFTSDFGATIWQWDETQ